MSIRNICSSCCAVHLWVSTQFSSIDRSRCTSWSPEAGAHWSKVCLQTFRCSQSAFVSDLLQEESACFIVFFRRRKWPVSSERTSCLRPEFQPAISLRLPVFSWTSKHCWAYGKDQYSVFLFTSFCVFSILLLTYFPIVCDPFMFCWPSLKLSCLLLYLTAPIFDQIMEILTEIFIKFQVFYIFIILYYYNTCFLFNSSVY